MNYGSKILDYGECRTDKKSRKKILFSHVFVLKFMLDFLRASKMILLSGHALGYYVENQTKVHVPIAFDEYTKITKGKAERVLSILFLSNDSNSEIALDGRTIESYFDERKSTTPKLKTKALIVKVVAQCFEWVLQEVHATRVWGQVPNRIRRSILQSLAAYTYHHPQQFQFDYYQSQDHIRQRREMEYVKTIVSLCREEGIISEVVVGIIHTLSRYGVTHYSQQEAIAFTIECHSLAKKCLHLPHSLLLGIFKSMLYLRSRGEHWLVNFDSWENRHLYEEALQYAASDLEIAGIQRLEAEAIMAFSSGYYHGKIKSLLDQSSRFFYTYQQEDTHKWQMLTADAMEAFYVLESPRIALRLFEDVKDRVIKTKGLEWNHQLFGSVLLHMNMCQREIGHQSSQADTDAIRRMVKQCNFENYYQLCDKNRRSTMLSLQKLVQ